jgi:hypothetical protein
MEKEYHKEWRGLELRALDVLRKGSSQDGIGIRRVLQVVEMPSFRPASSWEIFEQHSRSAPTSHFAVCLRWRYDLDSQKYKNPLERLNHPQTLDPTIETQRIDLKANFVTEARSRLSQIAVPAYAEPETVGCDGTGYELAFGDVFLGARFTWWESPPGPLKALAGEAQRILKDLEAL